LPVPRGGLASPTEVDNERCQEAQKYQGANKSANDSREVDGSLGGLDWRSVRDFDNEKDRSNLMCRELTGHWYQWMV